jgi:hypothetical protein
MLKWIPSGTYPGGSIGYRLYARFGHFNTPIRIKSLGYNMQLLEAPDRQVLIAPSWYEHRYEPDEALWDFTLSLCVTGDFVASQCDMAMISAFHVKKLGRSKRKGGDRTWIDSRVKLLADSGGAQLKMGTTHYIDPKGVIQFMNDYTDIGVSLDVPPRPVDQTAQDVLDALTQAQIKNNDVMAGEARDDLVLLNAIHGFTYEQTKRWAHKVNHPRFTGWAIGPDNVTSFVLNIRTMFMLKEEFGVAPHYHYFGVSGPVSMSLLAWASRYYSNVTSDSTTHLGGGRSRTCMLRNHTGKAFNIRTKDLLNGTRLSCDCPVCWMVGYGLAFKTAPWLQNYHSLATIVSYTNFLNGVARSMTAEAYKKLVTSLYPRSAKDLRIGIDYIEMMEHEGVAKADAAFKHKIKTMPSYAGDMHLLFDEDAPEKDPEVEQKARRKAQRFRNRSKSARAKEKKKQQQDRSTYAGLGFRQRRSVSYGPLIRYLSNEELAEFGLVGEEAGTWQDVGSSNTE